ncbi:acyl-CoA synthetase family protein [Halorubrum depositum]|uniref:AMP-binding protein n=1 Tax=Halorubrum depositum TaxID=2583992 RepID=UPI0011A2ED44|nr:AMP-binding protein [Halorubrum depositum]
MDVVGDLLARDRRSRDVALVTPDGRERTYRDLITNAYKAANVLRYLGAREGSTVAVEPAPGLHTTLAFLGAAGLGAPVRFDPAAGIVRGDRVVLVDVADESTTEPAPGTSLAAFGGPPERPETTHWEQELWSENPGMPPSGVGPDDPVLRGANGDEPDEAGDVSHRALLDAAGSVVDELRLEQGDRAVLRGDLADSRALAAGVVAPLAAGATSVLAGEATDDGEPTVTVEREDGDSPRVTLPTVGDR